MTRRARRESETPKQVQKTHGGVGVLPYLPPE